MAAWAKRALGLELMDWQIHALRGQLSHDGTGKLFHRRSLVSVARQNGKSTALAALVGWWLVEGPRLRGGPQTVITVAHQLDLATALFQYLAPVLEAQYDAKAKWSYGRNELTMPDGSLWLVRAATPAAGHGRSPDLVVADELWDIDGDVLEQGLIPAQRARRSPLCSMWSTAGTEASRYMQRLREEGIAGIDSDEGGSLFMAEWSPAPGADLDDPQTWIAANPAIGTTLELDTLIAESKTPNRNAFYRASLNLWIASDRAWLDPSVWEKAGEPGRVDEAPVVLAIDSSKDGERYVGVIARPLPGGDPGAPRVRLEVAFNCRTEAEMWRKVAETMPASPCQLAVTPGLDSRVPLELARRRVVVGEQEIRKWTGLVGGLIADRRVCHDKTELLSEHMCRAVAVTSGAGLTLSSYKSPGPIELARCAVWAAALATRPTRSGRPMIVTSAAR